MSLIYGERRRAFRRLQEEIIKATNDLSILAWYWSPQSSGVKEQPLASSPRYFQDSQQVWIFHPRQPGQKIGLTSRGIELEALIIDSSKGTGLINNLDPAAAVAVLNCPAGLIPGTFAALRLLPFHRPVKSDGDGARFYARVVDRDYQFVRLTLSMDGSAVMSRNSRATDGEPVQFLDFTKGLSAQEFRKQGWELEKIVIPLDYDKLGFKIESVWPQMTFWVEPVGNAKFGITVSDVFSHASPGWDRSSLQCQGNSRDGISGIAKLVVTDAGARKQGPLEVSPGRVLGNAFLVFGGGYRAPENKGWCGLCADDGTVNPARPNTMLGVIGNRVRSATLRLTDELVVAARMREMTFSDIEYRTITVTAEPPSQFDTLMAA